MPLSSSFSGHRPWMRMLTRTAMLDDETSEGSRTAAEDCGGFPKVTITVLGDLVADEFVYGEISRVSREAPVLILKHRERTWCRAAERMRSIIWQIWE